MLVREVMVEDVTVVTPDTSIDAVAQIMADLDVGALPVGPSERTPEGIITDRDILLRVVARGRDPRITPVSEAMSSQLFFCHAEDDAEDVLREMELHQVRRMPVVDATGKMIGLVTLGDLERGRRHERVGVKPRRG